ncbi:outer membrane beta-barrel protein [Mucilaginibacter sp.]
MKLLTRFLLTGVIVILYTFSSAQNGYFIKGKVLLSSSLLAEGATVTIFNSSDSTIIKSIACDKLGNFGFSGIKRGSYIFSAKKIGYRKFYSNPYLVNSNITIKDITLVPEINTLNEVSVTGKRNYIEVQPNKTVLNVDRSVLAAGNSVFDILATAPGVRIIQNGIYIRGGQKALIAINGKSIGQLNDEQLADLLKSYQSSMISQIEIITNPPARYDAAGGGVINIILKKSKDYGFKANITESAAGGQDYKFNTGINLNYRTKDFNFFGSYNFAYSKTPRVLDIDRTIDTSKLNENYKSTSFLKNNGFNGGIDYNITPKQTIGGLVFGYDNLLGIDKGNITNILNNSVLDSNIITKSHINRSIANLNYNFNYRGSFGKNDKTTLGTDFDYSTYRRYSSELLDNDFLNVDGSTYRDPLFYMDNSPSQINVRSEKIDFTQALSATGSLSVGMKNNQVNSNNNIEFGQRSDATLTFTPVPSLTDHFIYNERINAAYLGYSDKYNKTNVSVSFRGEQTNSYAESLNPNKTILRSYFDLFPNLEITQPANKDNILIFDYNRRIVRPNYQDLNPFVSYIDQYSYSTGNTLLKPEYYTTFQVTDMFKDKYKLDLSVAIVNNFFARIYEQNDTTKVFLTTMANIATRYEYNAEFTMPVNITKWWNADIYLLASYQQFDYFDHNVGNISTTDFEMRILQSFTLSPTVKAELYTDWESPTYYGINHYSSAFQSRAGVSKVILNGNGSIKLAVSDIFNSEDYRYTSQYTNLNLTGFEKTGSRFVTATFTYKFGKQSVKTSVKHNSGDSDEQKRLGGSNNEN